MVRTRYPRLRQTRPHGQCVLREGLLLCFFMKCPHEELSRAITAALDLYLDAIKPAQLGWYVDMGGDVDPVEHKGWAGAIQALDDKRWARILKELSASTGCLIQLQEQPNEAGGFRFEYLGRERDDINLPGFVSTVSFWLPTEYLEAHGPSHVKELAKALARELPFDLGYASLAFNYLVEADFVTRFIREHCMDYPGMDIPHVDISMSLGSKVKGAYWLNFYGQPLLEQLGGSEHLRTRLEHPDISIEELNARKVLVSLGEWPEMGTTSAHRILARALEPHLHEEQPGWFGLSREQLRQWQRRFLD
ncbi:type VI immunity family protein [Cystobacter fuscus]|uniref:type VI immunity family protein n=1 Tax=Cystobacter fuscus TaxID=43 RepID=UPI0037C16E66